ncbi:unnamed protein product [Didymodactylos carnosus]|uniref:Uncharacterized protein n=1 Tax=Didymodactylos carnosus TaxID=1234261 RepID=A0A813WE72_9BILA|nr:unnamed protein product [Didymodactylos carnosus]CAF0856191.1 unnamed protein product [Didymodactylos carnosus]CAF3504251.1 unnamed protein product [Didymodactylos carnosus]CAF3643955.1 unnamed protein product [Didymodactylos carnosus]
MLNIPSTFIFLFFFEIHSVISTANIDQFYSLSNDDIPSPFVDDPFENDEQSIANHSIKRRQVSLNILTSQQARLPIVPSYMIFGPRTIRPAEKVELSVTILRDDWNPMTVKALISNDDMDVASVEETFYTNVPNSLVMMIPPNARMGTYRLTLVGKLSSGEQKFYNQSELLFDQKAVSILIQLDRPVYRQETVVQFRCIPVYPDLAGYYGTIDVYMIGPSGHTLRKWENMQTTAGMISLEYPINDAPPEGTWTVKCRVMGYEATKTFEIYEFYSRKFEVNVTVPFYIPADAPGVSGIVVANYSTGMGVQGYARVYVRARDMTQLYDPRNNPLPDVEFDRTTPTFVSFIDDFNGVASFYVPMSTIRSLVPNLDGSEILITATVHDPWWNETNNGTTVVSFYQPGTYLNFLGGASMVFKPRMLYTTYIAAVNSDGSKYRPGPGRFIRVYTNTDLGQSQAYQDYPIDNTAIAQHQFLAPSDPSITILIIRAELYDNNIKVQNSDVEQRAIRYLSPSNSYIQVTSSTSNPKVGDFMIFRVNITQFTEAVYYHITSAGRLIYTDILRMDQSKQKSFDVGVTREMAPSAHIIVYYIRYDGEIVADSMNFHVNTSSVTNHVNITVNRRKDFTGNTIEILAYASPQSLVAFAALGLPQYRLFPPGNHFDPIAIYDELYSFDRYATQSFQQTWNQEMNVPYSRVFFPSQSYGYDAGSTFNSTGLQLFTNIEIKAIQTACTQSGLFQCNDGNCYAPPLRCNAVIDCRDGADEANCNYTRSGRYNFTPLSRRLWPYWERELQLHFMWHQQFAYPDGRVQFRIAVPNVIASWVITAVAVSRLTGFGVLDVPHIYEGTRQFFIKVEIPPIVRFGEQIGARVDVFNFQSHRIEALIILHASDKYRFVNLDQNGLVSSYSPRLTDGQHHVLIILYPNEVRRISIPFVPIVAGEVEVMIEGITGVSRDFYREIIKVNYEGVRNYYHTPTVLLLNNLPRQMNEYEVNVTQNFILPLKNFFLYIPGSATCEVFVSGDVAGPYFLLGYDEWLNTDNLIMRTTAPADSGIFDFSMMVYNLKYMLQGHGGRAFDNEKLMKVLTFANMEYLRFMAMYIGDNIEDPWRKGSFSEFGFSNESSIWLTSWALMALKDAVYPEWEEKALYIDPNLRSDIVAFLCLTQTINGSWAEFITPNDRNKFGLRVTNISNMFQQLNLSLTAQAIIALKLNTDIRGPAARLITGAIDRGRLWLEKYFRSITDAFDMAIVTYALHVTNSADQNAAFLLLDKFRQTNENGIYYSNRKIPGMEKTWPNINPRYGPKPVQSDWEAHAVAATAFVLMTYTQRATAKEAEQIMLWLQSMRNYIGGWGASYDTVIAQRAIVSYSVLRGYEITNYNIRINLTSSSSADQEHEPIVITDENLIEAQVRSVQNVWGVLYVDGFGNGYALVQMHVGVNVEFPFYVRRPDYEAFRVDIVPYLSGRNFSTIDYNVCLGWNPNNVIKLGATRSGTAAIEIQIPTGYRVEERDLKVLIRTFTIRNLREAENWPGQINFLFDYVDVDPICFQFQAKRWLPVANVSRYYEVRAYEWLEPGNMNRSVYQLRNLFGLDICEIMEKEYPLHWYVWHNEPEKLESILKDTKESIEQLDPRHRTPIQLAVCLGRLECAKILAQNDADCTVVSKDGWNLLQEAVSNGNQPLIKLIMKYRNYQRNKNRIHGIPDLLRKLKESEFYVEMKWEFTSWVPLVSKLCPNDTYKIYKSGPNVRIDTTLLGIEGTNWQRGNRTLIFSLLDDSAKMLDIDHETQTVFIENLTMPGEEPLLIDPDIEQIDSKLSSPNMTVYLDVDKIEFERSKSGVWGMRSEKTETINGYPCKVYSVQNFALVTRTRVEHMTAEEKKAHEAGNTSNKNFLGGLTSFLESSSSSSKPATTTTIKSNIPATTQEQSRSSASASASASAYTETSTTSTHQQQRSVTAEEYFNPRVDLKYRDVGRQREETVKTQTFNAQLSLCDNYPLSLQEQILPIIDLMAISNSHFKKLRDFVTLQLPQGFPVKVQIPLYHVLTAKVTFGNIHGIDKPVQGVSTITDDATGSFCAVDENIFSIPPGYRRQGEGEGFHPLMYMDDDALLQMAIERSLLESSGNDAVTLYEALEHPPLSNRFMQSNNVDYDLQRALEASLLTSGLSETEVQEALRQHQQQPLLETENISAIMEISKREEEERLKRLKEEEEEFEKVLQLSLQEK